MQEAECQDRRITRSKRALRAALVALTEERGLDGFTVNELCERAGLNRGTFYNHFRDKDDLVAALEGEVMAGLETTCADIRSMGLADLLQFRLNRKPLPFLVELFDYLHGQGDLLHALLGAGGDPGFGPKLAAYVSENFVVAILHERYRASDDPFVGYYAAFYATAYLGVITRWVETGMKESSENMARIAMRLLFIKPGDPIKL